MRTLAAVGVITPTSRTLTVRAGAFRAQDRASQARPVTLAQLEDLRVSLQLIESASIEAMVAATETRPSAIRDRHAYARAAANHGRVLLAQLAELGLSVRS